MKNLFSSIFFIFNSFSCNNAHSNKTLSSSQINHRKEMIAINISNGLEKYGLLIYLFFILLYFFFLHYLLLSMLKYFRIRKYSKNVRTKRRCLLLLPTRNLETLNHPVEMNKIFVFGNLKKRTMCQHKK